MEELDYDEYGSATGTPILPFVLPSKLDQGAFIPNIINATLETRLYTFDNLRDKRFSSVEIDLMCDSGSRINTYFDTINPDTTTEVDSFGSEFNEDVTRRITTRKIAYGAKLRFIVNNLSASIRATNIIATLMGKQNISKK